jgi:TolB-like protein
VSFAFEDFVATSAPISSPLLQIFANHEAADKLQPPTSMTRYALILLLGIALTACTSIPPESAPAPQPVAPSRQPVIAQSFESEVSVIADAVSAAIVRSGKRKVATLDFTDLRGSPNELGRFLSEQISVELVNGRKDFAVVDRASLNSILTAHNLTALGLVNPDNVKKLGEFAGVDAIIMGTITPLQDAFVVSVKIIATDTAELVGAAKGRINRTNEIQQLLDHDLSGGVGSGSAAFSRSQSEPAAGSSQSDLTKHVSVEKNSTKVGDLFIRVESVRRTKENDRVYLVATIAMVNTNQTASMFATIASEGPNFSKITDGNGNAFSAYFLDIVGIEISGMNTRFSEVEPNGSLKVTMRHEIPFQNSNPARTVTAPYRIQFTLLAGKEIANGQLINGRKSAVLIDVE